MEVAVFLTRLAEFQDRNLEMEYIDHDIRNSMKYIRPVILIFGILYFAFIIPDYLFMKNINNFWLVLLNRTAVLFSIIFLYFILNRLKSCSQYCQLITAYEIMVTVCFILTFYLYESPDFMIQSFGIMIIILGFYILPNRWIYMLISSVTVSTVFFICAVTFIKSIEEPELIASIVYTILVLVFISISSFRINCYKRIHYANNRELVRLSSIDSLTGVYNRAKFDREIAGVLGIAREFNFEAALIFFDFDDFKKINDHYGHLAGDRVLVSVISLVKKLIRENDLLFRWGGEEFVIILPNTGSTEAFQIAERLRNEISKHSVSPVEEGITCSFGVALLDKEDDVTSFVRRADKLHYQAKKSGKNKVVAMY